MKILISEGTYNFHKNTILGPQIGTNSNSEITFNLKVPPDCKQKVD